MAITAAAAIALEDLVGYIAERNPAAADRTREAILAEFTRLTLAARLATEFDTDVVVDADATPGLLPRGSGFMLIRPSGEAFLVNEDEVAVEPDDPPDDEDAFVIDERPGAMRPVARIPS